MEELLRKLVAFPSVTGNSVATHELLAYVAEYLNQRGMHIEWYFNGGYESLVATSVVGQRQPVVLLAAHVDVVPAPEALFELRKQDGTFIGRGVLDMKCAIAAYMQAVDKLKDNLDDYDFAIMLTSDEEIGAKDGVNGVVHLIDQGYLPKMLILPDGGQNWQLEAASNGFAHISLQASGRSAHSSRPWEGESATFKLVHALNDIQLLFKDHGPSTDTLNVASIHNEGPINRIPDTAQAELSIRITQAGGLDKWTTTLTDICTAYQVKLIVRSGWDPTFNDIHNPYIRRYSKISTAVTGLEINGFKSYAGSDARYFADRGVPYANAYPKGGGHHSDYEWLDEAALEQLGAIILQYVREVATIDSRFLSVDID